MFRRQYIVLTGAFQAFHSNTLLLTSNKWTCLHTWNSRFQPAKRKMDAARKTAKPSPHAGAMPCTATHMAIRVVNAVLALASLAKGGTSVVSAAESGGAFDARVRRKVGPATMTMLPLVVNTWTGDFSKATERAWDVIAAGGADSALLDAVEQGCKLCEDIQCGGSVGYGGHPDSGGEVTLDSMVMFGPQHSVGAVACLRRIKNASSVARAVMEHTEHTMLAGEGATAFAMMLGLEEESLDTDASRQVHQSWLQRSCQPNYYRNFDGAGESCPPYPPPTRAAKENIMRSGYLGAQQLLHDDQSEVSELVRASRTSYWQEARSDPARLQITEDNHDTIGMVVVDERGDLACGTTTNGAANKIAGRVGDSPVAGAGCYVENDVGGAAATGDGDVMMRFLPSFRAVESMRAGASPQDACAEALCKISRFYPTFGGALVCVNKDGEHGAARHGLSFSYSYQSPRDQGSQTAHAIEVDDEVCERVTAASYPRWSPAPL